MADDAVYQVEYGGEDGATTDWISKPGKCKITYPNGNVFEGTYDDEKKKQGQGSYSWSVNDADEDEGAKNTANYKGGYKDGKKDGLGKMVYPNGDKYQRLPMTCMSYVGTSSAGWGVKCSSPHNSS